ncbi:adhesin-like protein [Methanobrevibacter ruminantium M1]|uniref:Adhesin-like protein n=1 Tax=Methanobrevibacter ruminantium (strain ATCC 35063 / DSM 1093 / JCM 13430 / OCM 146 / M1) TaxID=634498 RepID=D3E363_METRM|nr:hypothetical protein [Methanobrevibacter ruminantium]ADC46974.1 adhesin-like protein [Methanobrevibacter ruminantium M1]
MSNSNTDSSDNASDDASGSEIVSGINEELESNNLLTEDLSVDDVILQTSFYTSYAVKSAKSPTVLTFKNSTVVKGDKLYIYLKDSSNHGISGEKVIFKFSNSSYTRTTDSNGMAALDIKLNPNKYAFSAIYDGSDNYSASRKDFTLTVAKVNTKLTSSSSVVRGRNLYTYLKDKNNNALSNKKISITISGKTYTVTTDKNGRASLKLSLKTGTYSTKINFAGDKTYNSQSLSKKIKIYTLKTVMTIPSTSVVRGQYIYAYLKDSDGNALSGQKVVMKFDKIYFNLKTDKNGRVALKINTRLGKIPVKASFAGSTSYSASSKSVTITSYVEKTKITVENSTVKRGKYFYAYLKDSKDKGISNQKVKITLANINYTKTTDSNGKVALKIEENPGNYTIKLNFAKTNSYYASSKSLKINVLNNATAKIIAKDQTVLGEYSVRLTDMNSNPLANQTVEITAATVNRSVGSGLPITKKTVVINSDNIYNKATDSQFIKSIGEVLKSKGYKVIINSNIGPNAHCTDAMGAYSDVCIFCIFGGVDSGMFVDMAASWYQNLLKKYDNEVVLGFTHTQRNLATDTWLERAHDDDYSPKNFTGLSYPGTYLNDYDMDYVYGRTATEMANNFIKYAVNGLSIGLNNTVPCNVMEYNVTTGDNGYATITDLLPGDYAVISSYINKTAGYVADTVISIIEVK